MNSRQTRVLYSSIGKEKDQVEVLRERGGPGARWQVYK